VLKDFRPMPTAPEELFFGFAESDLHTTCEECHGKLPTALHHPCRMNNFLPRDGCRSTATPRSFLRILTRRLAWVVLLGWFSGYPAQAEKQIEGPVVFLIHGMDGCGEDFAPMSDALASAGFRPITLEYFPSDGRGGVDGAATQVYQSFLSCEHLLKNGGYAMVGFSMGGIVAHYLLAENFAIPKPPKVLITISSPHRGTVTAWLRWNRAAAQLRPGSRFLKNLAARFPRSNETRYATIRSPFDLIVVPSGSSIVRGAENFTIPVLLHAKVIHNRRVIQQVVRVLHESFAN
jgi:triacylglycerol lipase